MNSDLQTSISMQALDSSQRQNYFVLRTYIYCFKLGMVYVDESGACDWVMPENLLHINQLPTMDNRGLGETCQISGSSSSQWCLSQSEFILREFLDAFKV